MSSLSFADKACRLCITASTVDFDNELIRWCELEGFDTTFIPYNYDDRHYIHELNALKQELRVTESYAVISFGDAAAFCLEHYLKVTNTSKLCALIAYYPSRIPDPECSYASSMRVLVHLADQTVQVLSASHGTDHKRHIVKRRVGAGQGTGDRLDFAYTAYSYPGISPGFAESDLDNYDPVATEIAWTRTLSALQSGFQKHLDLEKTWEGIEQEKYFSSDMSTAMTNYTTEETPTVTYIPTLKGASGIQALHQFYKTSFLQGRPPSMRLRLLSRTIGADRVVDELYVTFKHTQEMAWILPGLQPTDRQVEIVLVSIVTLRGGKLYSEHIYWDQASVLVQVGLIDRNSVPEQAKGITALPIIGREAAKKILLHDKEESIERKTAPMAAKVDGSDIH
ncbi:Dienelactone hydrolase family protein [Aspergillus parasiticus SU-1]|uniref:Dienelactone hydrolase family protein n=1 Tax=Aspergillus parasiticus (strain ATCC 56775 / NRRL 5862 / SRRC 143 / SU-1) TaxID=1403190 RepID=A0A0F0IBM3_ASPPU|nr:Dienelactone hydrolase family protein [Aspergillus parasiticus SU-1]